MKLDWLPCSKCTDFTQQELFHDFHGKRFESMEEFPPLIISVCITLGLHGKKKNNGDVEKLASDAYGYVIFPNVGKGAFIAGGAAGNGVVYKGGQQIGWAKLRQVDVGLQIGGEAFREAIFFQSKQDLEEFMSSELEFTGGVSAVAITKGESKSVNFEDGMAVVTMPKGGAMIEISVGGQKFKYQDM